MFNQVRLHSKLAKLFIHLVQRLPKNQSVKIRIQIFNIIENEIESGDFYGSMKQKSLVKTSRKNVTALIFCTCGTTKSCWLLAGLFYAFTYNHPTTVLSCPVLDTVVFLKTKPNYKSYRTFRYGWYRYDISSCVENFFT